MSRGTVIKWVVKRGACRGGWSPGNEAHEHEDRTPCKANTGHAADEDKDNDCSVAVSMQALAHHPTTHSPMYTLLRVVPLPGSKVLVLSPPRMRAARMPLERDQKRRTSVRMLR